MSMTENISLQFVFGHTRTRRNVYSCNFRSNLMSKKGNVYSLLDSVILISLICACNTKKTKFVVINSIDDKIVKPIVG